jgi:hypothetical protein
LSGMQRTVYGCGHPHAYLLENGRHKEEVASLMAGIADRGILQVLFHPDISSRV